MSTQHPIVVEGITKRFGRVQALDSVSFSVPAGTLFAIVGENGAGKTTLIQILLGLLRADGGSAQVLGLDPARHGRRIRRMVGYVPEQPAFYDWMTVEELGWFAAALRGSETSSGFASYVQQFRVPTSARIGELSRGMRARVVLALALAHDPPLLLLDEPTGGLDALVRRDFMETMVDLVARGKTVFLSSHEIDEVERVADYVAVLHQGKLVLCEELRPLLQRYGWITLTVESEHQPTPPVAGTIHLVRRSGRTVDLLVEGDIDRIEAQVAEHPQVRGVRVQGATLEDVVVAALSRGREESPLQSENAREFRTSPAEPGV